MKITSAQFIKGLNGTDEILDDGLGQIAFVGRSNVGKSSIINSLTGQKDLAHSSSFPGRTQEINIFLVNNKYYFVDLPGYGFAKASQEDRERLRKLVRWYLFDSHYIQKKVVLIIDANVGLTDTDTETLDALEEHKKEIIVVANKIDKIRKSEQARQLKFIQSAVGYHKVIPYSVDNRIGVEDLMAELFSDGQRSILVV